MLAEGVEVKQIARLLGTTAKWIEDRRRRNEILRDLYGLPPELDSPPTVEALHPVDVRNLTEEQFAAIMGDSLPSPFQRSATPINTGDLTPGSRVGRLIVERVFMDNGQRMASCRCDCGTIDHRARASDLRAGKAKSCGCLQRERAEAMRKPSANGGDPVDDVGQLVLWAAPGPELSHTQQDAAQRLS
jgi:hypothetical protein